MVTFLGGEWARVQEVGGDQGTKPLLGDPQCELLGALGPPANDETGQPCLLFLGFPDIRCDNLQTVGTLLVWRAAVPGVRSQLLIPRVLFAL